MQQENLKTIQEIARVVISPDMGLTQQDMWSQGREQTLDKKKRIVALMGKKIN